MKLNIVFPDDPSTAFLRLVINQIIQFVPENDVNLITVCPSSASYLESYGRLEALPLSSIILFMGHGEQDRLLGGSSEHFKRAAFIAKDQAKVFSDKYVFLLSCNSNDFLRSTLGYSKIRNAVGFGGLPTEMWEVEKNKRLIAQGVNEKVIESYKSVLVEIVSTSFIQMMLQEVPFHQMIDLFILRLNKKISEVLLTEPREPNSKILADLLFQLKSEMVYV